MTVGVSTEALRQAIAEARAQPLDEEARPNVIVKLWRAREPQGRTCKVLGAPGEILTTERVGGGFLCGVRVFCDDLERALDRLGPGR